MAASYGFAFAINKHNAITAMTFPDEERRVDVWKQRENISNMGFAEASLGNLMQIWTVSGIHRQEVHRCRLALEAGVDDDAISGTKRIER